MRLWPLFVRMVLFKGHRQQMTIICLFILNFILTLFTISTEMEDARQRRIDGLGDDPVSLIALSNSPASDEEGSPVKKRPKKIMTKASAEDEVHAPLASIASPDPDPEADAGPVAPGEAKAAVDDGKMSPRIKGYNLAKRVQNKCKQSAEPPYRAKRVKAFLPYTSSNNKTQVCAIWKIGTTFLKRLFMIENRDGSGQMTHNPYDIPFSVNYVQTNRRWISNSESSSRFMFTRDPYSRLYAAYVDKFFAPNPIFWTEIGKHAVKTVRNGASQISLRCGHDLTFPEYIRYVILTLTNTSKGPIDGHSIPMTLWCKPCEIKYDFIGKMENFNVDSLELVKNLNLKQTENIIKENGESLAADDAIRDTLGQAFDYTYRTYYEKCITFEDALKRSWRKLQYRGIIGNQPLDLSKEDFETLSLPQAIHMARKAREWSTKDERASLRRKHFVELYSSVSEFDLHMLRHIYREDFDLFEYNESPDIWLTKNKDRDMKR